MKDDFEAAVISAINKVCQDSVITACNFHFNQCLWRQLQNTVIRGNTKKMEQVRLTYRMSAALAHLLIKKVEEGWLMMMENFPQNEKLALFLDYFVEQRMENQNVPIEMWSINKHQHRTKSAVGGWKSKLKSIKGKQQPNVFCWCRNYKNKQSRYLGNCNQRTLKSLAKNEERFM